MQPIGCKNLTSFMRLMAQLVKNPGCNAGDLGLIPGLERSLGEGNGNPLQYFCLGNPMDKVAWWATVHEFAKQSDNLAIKQL